MMENDEYPALVRVIEYVAHNYGVYNVMMTYYHYHPSLWYTIADVQ